MNDTNSIRPIDSIDFLPARYRAENAHRSANVSRLVVVGAFVCLIAMTAVFQYRQHSRLTGDLAFVTPQYTLAEQKAAQLKEMLLQLGHHNDEARLLTYLRHPWPMSQILAASVDSLPETISLDELQIVRQQPPATQRRPAARQRNNAQAQLTEVQTDLKELLDQTSQSTYAVILSGTASETADVHRYLGELGRNWFFNKVDLLSVESNESPTPGASNATEQPIVQSVSFRARMTVRQGYGQKHGPVPQPPAPAADLTAQTKTEALEP